MSDLDRRATATGTRLSVGAGVVAALLLVLADPLAGGLGVLGVVSVAVSLRLASRSGLAAGTAVFGLGVLVSTTADPPATATALTVVLVVACWDSGTRAIRFGRDLTRAAETARLERSQAATTAAVGVGSLAVAAAGVHVVGGFDSVAPVVAAALAAAACVLALARL